jgi:peptidoglycan/LPS O-acetylase OafA/YrhL
LRKLPAGLLVDHVSAPAAPRDRVFHTLDALRGIAAMGVVVFHWQEFFAPVAAPGGYLAVDLFFMMSGVVLAHAYERRFAAGMTTLKFMRARFIRLYPLYVFGTVLGVAVAVASMCGNNTEHWDIAALSSSILLALLFLPDIFGNADSQLFPLNIPCWSLFHEIVINAAFALTWSTLKPRRLIIVSVLTGCALGAVILHSGNADQGSNLLTLWKGLLRTTFGFSVGVLIAGFVRRLPRKESNAAVLAVVAIVLAAMMGRPTEEWRALWDAACILLLFPVVVLCGTVFDPSPRLLQVSTFLGLTSYAVYVLHGPMSSILNTALRRHAVATNSLGGAPYAAAAILAALLAACWLIDRYLDLPVRRLLARALP